MSAISRPVTYVTKVDFAQLDGYGIPADGLGNLGDRYYDIGAGRWYLKRWVGNFINDTAICQTPVIGGNVDWEASFLFNAMPGVNNQRFIGQNNSNYIAGEFNVDQLTTTATMRVGLSGGVALIKANALDGNWHKVEIWRRSRKLGFAFDGTLVANDTTIRTTLDAVNLCFGTGTSGGRSTMKCCNFLGSREGIETRILFDEGSGAIANDSIGNNNGVITDGTPISFWYQSWVPMDLL